MKRKTNSSSTRAIEPIMKLFFIAILGATILSACQSETDRGNTMSKKTMSKTIMSKETAPENDIKTVMDAHVDELMEIVGVIGVAIGALDDGTPCIKIYVTEKTPDVNENIPEKIEGHPTLIEISSEFKPLSEE